MKVKCKHEWKELPLEKRLCTDFNCGVNQKMFWAKYMKWFCPNCGKVAEVQV